MYKSIAADTCEELETILNKIAETIRFDVVGFCIATNPGGSHHCVALILTK